MAITTVLFDLDGTLLPMDQDVFTTGYFKSLCKKVAPLGYEPEKLVKAIWAGMAAMVKNDGSETNEKAFWKFFATIFGDRVYGDMNVFNDFYANDFKNAKIFCGYDPKAAIAVRSLKDAGYRVALATNPIFPSAATEERIRWTDLEPDDFELYTTYENTSYCKPNLKYYEKVMSDLSVSPQECIMVGNDVGEDMVARDLGCDVFLIKACMINKAGADISDYPQGDFDDLLRYIKNLEKNS